MRRKNLRHIATPRHTARRRQPPGSTTRRGYGHDHQKLRAKIKPTVDAGLAWCARCHQPIAPGTAWHLDHTDDRTGYLGPSHEDCNINAAQDRRFQPQPPKARPPALAFFDSPRRPAVNDAKHVGAEQDRRSTDR